MVDGVGIDMQKSVGERHTKGDSALRAVDHTGIAMPTFIREFDLGHFVLFTIKDKDIRVADIGAGAAAHALVSIDNGRHADLLGKCDKHCAAQV